MATIGDSTELPPIQFPISFFSETQNGALSIAVENCQLCGGSRRSFYCKSCIRDGEITKSKVDQHLRLNHIHKTEREDGHVGVDIHVEDCYKDKVSKWKQLLSLKEDLDIKCQTASEQKTILAAKKSAIILAHKQNEMLKVAINHTKNLLQKEKVKVTKLQEEFKLKKSKTGRREEKKKRIKQYIDKFKNKIERVKVDIQECSPHVCEVSIQHVQDLVRFIFPISEISPKSSTEQNEETTVDLLAEARHTSYIKGRWVYVGHCSELEHDIVHPTLPGNGDYSAYHLWSQANKDENTGPESRYQQRNPAYNIGAALQYTAQLITLLSYFLDVNLPYRVWYSDFGKDLTEEKFQTLVFKLNSNVLHLCFSQNVDILGLNPHHTLQNVLLLIQTQHLGRVGNFDVPNDLMQSFEENCPVSLSDLENSYHDGDDDDVDCGDVEWEQVSGMLPEAEMSTPGSSFYSSTQVSNKELDSVTASQSITGGLMSSASAAVSSLWRGWGAKPSPR